MLLAGLTGCSAELGVGPQHVGRLNEPVVPATKHQLPWTTPGPEEDATIPTWSA